MIKQLPFETQSLGHSDSYSLLLLKGVSDLLGLSSPFPTTQLPFIFSLIPSLPKECVKRSVCIFTYNVIWFCSKIKSCH